MNNLLDYLDPEKIKPKVKVVLLYGMGGIGKTTLATAAYDAATQSTTQLEPKYSAGNFGNCKLNPEINDESYLASMLRPALRQLGVQCADGDSLSGLHKRMASMRDQLATDEEPVLLYIDDVRDKFVANKILPGNIDELLPKG